MPLGLASSAEREWSVTRAVVEGRSRLLLFVISGARTVPVSRLSPAARLEFTAEAERGGHLLVDIAARTWLGILISLLPLMVLAASVPFTDPDEAPGWITWLWCSALSGINLIFLVIGPLLWNALITAAIAIDDLELAATDARDVAEWLRRHYLPLPVQAGLVIGGACVGAGLLWFINYASGSIFTLGPGEYAAMAVTAALATNGLWILWWIAAFIPTLGRQGSLRLDWNNPAGTPAVLFLNRALWKVAAAISLGMVLLALAVQGQPSPFSTWGATPAPWIAAVVVEYLAFLIVAGIFIRDGVWAQWQIFRVVRVHINVGWKPVRDQLRNLASIYPSPDGRESDVIYFTDLDRHFDGLRSVDLKLGWALAWATSIFGAAVSLIASALTLTPS
jgi:hypothetical protein